MRVAVVGGGFSGLIFSIKLSEAGLSVTLYEEHDRVGFPKHCTGLVSSRTVMLIGDPARRCVVRSFRKVRLVGESASATLTVEGEIVRLDRVRLEEELLREAEKAGVNILLSTRVEKVTGDGYLKSSGSVERYDAVILAEGHQGSLRKLLGFRREPRRVYGVNRDYDAGPRVDHIEVYLGRVHPHGFFAWLVPGDRGVTLGSGATSGDEAMSALERFEKKLGLEKPRESYGGIIPLGPPSTEVRVGRVFVVGDAAGLNKPLTGGGLYPNALAAEAARRLVARGVGVLEALEVSLKTVAKELRAFHWLAEVAHSKPELVEDALRVFSSIAETVELDYDKHLQDALTIAVRVISSPAALAFLARSFPHILLHALR